MYSGANNPPDQPLPVPHSHLVSTSIARSSKPAYDYLT